jgi:hypothetical protein
MLEKADIRVRRLALNVRSGEIADVISLGVAITNCSWLELLRVEERDEVNLWQPSGTRDYGAISVGELHREHRYLG